VGDQLRREDTRELIIAWCRCLLDDKGCLDEASCLSLRSYFIEFLVHIQISLPPDMGVEARNDLLERERQRGMELRRSGTIVRIWRIPGQFANVGIWNTADATELHAVLSSLPLFPWMQAQVTPLATHHLEAGLGSA